MSEAFQIEIQVDPNAPAAPRPAALAALVRFALAREGAAGPLAVSLVLTDDRTIADLHARHMAIEGPTDVLTFALNDGDAFPPGEAVPLLGEIVVSHETAAAQAAAYGHGPAREVAFLCLHGVLHLLGYDDADETERAAMLARQAEILAAFERATGQRV